MSGDRPSPLVIERILRDRDSIWQQIVAERDLNVLTGRMLTSSAIALACYGAVLGFFHSPLMALTSALKLPLLFLVTLAICLPTLYLFNLVFGARLSVRQSLALVMVAITVTSMLAVAFAPISLFFLITANDYGFFKLLNVAILTLSALVGLRFLTSGMQVLNDHGLLAPEAANATVDVPANAPTPVQAVPAAVPVGATPVAAAAAGESAEPVAVPAGVAVAEPTANGAVTTAPAPAQVPAQWPGQPAGASFPPGMLPPGYVAQRPGDGRTARRGEPTQRPASMTLLYIWILLFGFVGTQLAWTLRPFFGDPGQDFAFFRSIDGNFYAEILRTIANL
ncbi:MULTISPECIES: hypothetical protein [Micromonospora]|uniref:Actin-binding WH2 domain-containing protein n=1 Tax=Micromonospora vinacea TaxID=709878 RepID=A0ABS0K170_9ACTN|nr:hypothetical protein [Micromonospora vinacea]MBG6101933.1 hypothetical protein [Micromonospora vinacea]WSZ75257.1 hypothetical protein OH804_25530 [Micromonospora sp. NBC_00860]WTA68254.1 hypothetical protein OHB51_03525 [Micromonospora sp. NBC_00855]